MKNLPLESVSDIEKIAKNLLKESKANGILPTPVDRILQCAKLQLAQDINLANKKQSFFSKAFESIGKVPKKVLGLIDFRQKVIYLDLNQNVNRQRFIQLHEVGHDACPWQKYMYCVDDERTILPEITILFEKEASFFASSVLFQLDLFNNKADKLELSVKSAMALAKQFGASTHAALRRYVQYSKKRCALLVLEKPNNKQGYSAPIRNFFVSPSFIKEFGELNWPEACGPQFPFVQDIMRKRRFHEDGELVIPTLAEQANKFDYHYFDNHYNVFVFIKPVGEKIRSRTKVVLTST